MSRLLLLAALWLGRPAALAATAPAPTWSSPAPPTVVGVELLAPAGVDLTGVPPLLVIRRGQPFSAQLVRRSVELLYEEGRFTNVLVYEKAAPGGVALIFRLIPKLRLTGIGFHGNRTLDEKTLRRVSGLKAGDELTPERLSAAMAEVAAAYRRAGYPEARLAPEVTAGSTRAAVEVDVDEGPPLRARRVGVDGDLGLPAAQVRQAVSFEPGRIVDLDVLDEREKRLSKLYRARGYWQARVGPYRVREVGDGLADVDIPVAAGPRVELGFRGNLSFSREALLRALDYDGAERLDGEMLSRLSRRLRAFYVEQGFFQAAVRSESARRADRLIERFIIDEGRPLHVARIDVTGADHLSAEAVRAQILAAVTGEERAAVFDHVDPAAADALGVSGRPAFATPPRYSPDPPLYVPELYAEAARRLEQRYQDDGYLAASVPPPSIDIDERTGQAVVRVAIHEGTRTLLSSVRFEGVRQLPLAVVENAAGLEAGTPYSRPLFERARQQLSRAYARRGFPFARVEEQEEVVPDDPSGSVVYRIDEGPLVHIGRIILQGARRTRPSLIRHALAFSEGQVLDTDSFAATQQALAALGVFEEVQVSMIDPDVPEKVKDVLVSARERRSQEIVTGVGFSLVEGPRATIEYSYENLFGRALRFSSKLKVNYFPLSYLALEGPSGSLLLEGLPPEQTLTGRDNYFGLGGQMNASLTDPATFGWSGGHGETRLDAVAERVDRPYYGFSRAALVPGLDLRFGKRLTLTFQIQGEADQIQTYWDNLDQIFQFLSYADLENLRIPNGTAFLGSAGPAISWDLRDDPANPHRGLFATAKGLWVDGIFTPSQGSGIPGENLTCTVPGEPCPVDLFSTQGQVAGYVPLGRTLTLALSAQGGIIFPFGQSFVIPTYRFFMGGADSDRGFQQDLMLPQDFRDQLHRQVAACAQTASGASCTLAAQLMKNPLNQLPSPGGEVYDDLRAELRFPFPVIRALDMAVFLDAGNLWADPSKFSLLEWRPAAGVGLRLPTPIGPLVLDLGVNLNPDPLVNEGLIEPQFNIGTF